jgi:hypothetical protein
LGKLNGSSFEMRQSACASGCSAPIRAHLSSAPRGKRGGETSEHPLTHTHTCAHTPLTEEAQVQSLVGASQGRLLEVRTHDLRMGRESLTLTPYRPKAGMDAHCKKERRRSEG